MKEQDNMAKKVKDAYEQDSSEENQETSAAVNNMPSAEETGSQSEMGSAGMSDLPFEDLGSLIDELNKVTVALEEEQLKVGEMQSRYLRAVADMENYRKRALKEKEELGKLAVANFVEDLLPVLDNFRLGMQAADSHPEAKVVSDGFKMVLDQFLDVLKSKGIEEIAPNGKEFDPQFEECVSHLPHPEVPENHVIQTIRSGYRINERLIRAATVVVSSGPTKS